jgi:hypothetical protein
MSTGKKYFKVVYGFNEADYVPINENELVKSLFAFANGGKLMLEQGAIRGQDIHRIVPDWHAEKGWNRGYKMMPEDYEDIRPLEKTYRETYEQARLIAEKAIRENNPNLLNIPFSEAVKLLPKRNDINGLNGLAQKLQLN